MAKVDRNRRSSRSAGPDRGWSPHTAEKPDHARAGLPAGRPLHLPARVRREPRPPRPATNTHAVQPSDVHRENRLLLAGVHCSPTCGQWPRLIGIRCRPRQGKSAPQRQMCRQSCHDHTGRCRRAKVNAVAERYSSYETRRTRPPSSFRRAASPPSDEGDAATRRLPHRPPHPVRATLRTVAVPNG